MIAVDHEGAVEMGSFYSIEEYLSNKNFMIKEFLEEIDKRDLLLILFLAKEESELDISEPLNVENVEAFYKSLSRSQMAAKIRKLSKDELIDNIIEELDYDDNLENIVYKTLYRFAKEADFEFPGAISVLNDFIDALYTKKKKRADIDILEDKIFKINSNEELAIAVTNMLIFPSKPVLNALGILNYLGRIERKLNGAELDSELADNIERVREYLLFLLLQQFELTQESKLKNLFEQNTKLVNKLIKKEDTLSKTRAKYSNVSDELKVLKKEVRTIRKSFISVEQLAEKDQVIARLKSALKEKQQLSAEQSKAIELEQGKLIEGLEQQLKELKSVKSTLLDHIPEGGITAEEYVRLKALIEKYEYAIQQRKFADDEIPNEKKEQRIGYCMLENDKYYEIFPNNERLEIVNIPEDFYLSRMQFIRVEADGTFNKAFPYLYEPTERDYQIHSFGSVGMKDGENFIREFKQHNKNIILNIPANIQLRDNQVVSINARSEFYRFYRELFVNADTVLESIQAKGHKAYFVLKVLSNGVVLRNIITEEEEFKVLSADMKVYEQTVICLHKERLIRTFASNFYTFSSIYKKKEHGIVQYFNDTVLIKKMSGEVSIVQNLPVVHSLADGDILTVDELNNYMHVKHDNQVSSEKTMEQKKLNSGSKLSFRSRDEVIEITKEVLIVGRPTYEFNYKMALFRKGYKVTLVDGYEPYSKVKSAARDKDIIVVISDFCQHDNMYQLKADIKAGRLQVPIIYPKSEGANVILMEIEGYFNNELKQEMR